MDKPPFVFLGMPHHTRQVDIGAARGLYGTPCHPDSGLRCAPFDAKGSLLANAFNRLWCRALEYRKDYGFTHFAMIHSDVDPEPWWLSKMFAEMRRVGADVLSAVIPIKSHEGVTSTGLVAPGDPRRIVRRLTLRECHNKLPVTFSVDDAVSAGLGEAGSTLMVNTGLWLCDLNAPWAEDVCFSITDEIARMPDPASGDERWFANADPEDWRFSHFLAGRGARVFATRVVRVEHHGDAAYTNDEWGQWGSDHAYKAIMATGVAHTEALGKLVDEAASGEFRFPEGVRGWLKPAEGLALNRLAEGKRVLEIGAYCGKSTICLAASARHVDTIDPFDGRATGGGEGDTLSEFTENLAARGLGDKVTAHVGVTETISPTLANKRYDLVFIDGAHDAESVKTDVTFALSVLAPGGALAFHDYRTYPGEFDDRWDPGVTEVVNSLIADGAKLEARYLSLAVVRPPAAAAAA